MFGVIPNLTTLVLYGQLLRFRTDPVGGPQGQQDTHGGGVWGGGGIGSAANTATITLPHLHTLVLHPGVLKPRIHAPALWHFEFVFPDSKLSGQSTVQQLFVDVSFSSSLSSLSSFSYPSSCYASYPSSLCATAVHMNK
ncbi:hypothetical protein J3R82DRAFT_11231 [Butyriboletus roseoflavus]|nr:hypothetical protein J3R82DRAFT_11231 [Butyriboletus roseoflavus]